MTYIPTVPHSPAPPPSPRTRELAALLTKVLEEYRNSHPATSDAEIRSAVRLAQLASRSGNPAVPLILSVGIGLLVAGVLAAVLFLRAGEGVEIGASVPMVLMAVVILLGIVALLVKAGSR